MAEVQVAPAKSDTFGDLPILRSSALDNYGLSFLFLGRPALLRHVAATLNPYWCRYIKPESAPLRHPTSAATQYLLLYLKVKFNDNSLPQGLNLTLDDDFLYSSPTQILKASNGLDSQIRGLSCIRCSYASAENRSLLQRSLISADATAQ